MTSSDELSRDLAAALTRAQVFAVFQPQFEIQSGDLVAVEALARWQHPGHGLIAPQDFIPLAEESGIIHQLGRFMLEESLSAVDAWCAEGACIDVSVNVSPVQLTDGAFFDTVASALATRSLPPKALTIEITESLPVADFDVVLPQLQRLRSLGLGLSLDDFGRGYAGIDQLERLPVSEVKLDRSLIQSNDQHVALDVVSTIAKAHARGLCVVAEGIETHEHLERARELGCDRAQGFLLGMPMPRAEIDELRARRAGP